MNVTETDARKTFEFWVNSQISENSKDSYRRVVPMFIDMVFEKEIDDLNAKDIDGLESSEVYNKFVTPMKEAGRKNATILNYLYVVRSFVRELKNNRVFREFGDVDYDHCINNALSIRLKDDSEKRSRMTSDDYESFKEWLSTKFSARYADKNVKYPMALDFMFKTAIRIEATFGDVKWSNIKFERDTYGVESYVIYVLDKGAKVNRKPISVDYYFELKEIFYKGNDDDLVFGELSKQGFQRLVKEFCDETGADFSAHSIKVSAGTKYYRMTRDIYAVSRFLDHENIEVTKKYIRVDDDVSQAGSFAMSANIDIEKLDDVSDVELRRIIESDDVLAYTIANIAKSRGLMI